MRFLPFRFIYVLVILGVSFCDSAVAFSNNKLRVDPYRWTKIQTQHFDIYYDEKNKLITPRLAHYLEQSWQDVGDRLHFDVKERTPFFFYSDHNEFEQTNIVPVGEGTGGVTEAFKNRFLIFNDGSERWLRHVISHEFTHVVQFNVLYGGFWKSIRLLKSPFYPLWLMEGMAEWGSGDIDKPTGEMIIRDAVAHGILPHLPELQGFGHLKPHQVTLAYKTGEAAMNFLADEYGRDKVGKLLLTIRDFFDVSSALNEMLGTDLALFDFRFREYLEDKYYERLRHANPPTAYGAPLTFSDAIPQFNQAPIFDPSGSTMYFISDRRGDNEIYEYDFGRKTSKPLFGERWSELENIHARGRALSISPDGRWLAFSGERKQRDSIYLFDLNRRRLKKLKVPFDEVRFPVFSPDGERLACVGMVNGFNDLYLVDRKGRVVKKLTDSPQDERDPVFSLDGKSVYFSGEVMTPDGMDYAGRDIYKISIETRALEKQTHLIGEETEPEVLPDGSLVFVRDRDNDGRNEFNLYHLDRSTPTVSAMTDLVGGGFSPRYSNAHKALFFVGYDRGERHIYQGTWTFQEPGLAREAAHQSEDTTPLVEATDAWSDLPARKKHLDLTRARLAWPDNVESPLFLSQARPYRLKMSTDLFLPFLFFSTQEGLVAADLWQFSDLLGNHQFQEQLQYASGQEFLDLNLFYTYARFRPKWTAGFRRQEYFVDFGEQEKRREINGIGLLTYPLDRTKSVNIGIGSTARDTTFLDQLQAVENFDDRFYVAGLTYDTITGRYLVATRGRRVGFFYQQGVKYFGGDQDYKTRGLEAVQYVPLPRESTLAARLFYGRSTGRNPQVFRLGGVDRVRGMSGSSLANKKTNVALSSVEMRLRMAYLTWRTKFLFPDFFFKAAYLVAFDDFGYGWDNKEERDAFSLSTAANSAGLGISWPTFILQTFQINLSILWSKRTNDGGEIWYVTLSPSF